MNYSDLYINNLWFSDTFSYHFNGQEKDDEVYGKGNMTTAEYWQYDTRLGRRWNIDPKPQSAWSPYSVLNCSPFAFEDMAGDTPTVREAALMSRHVYADPKDPVKLEGGWEVAPATDLPKDFDLGDPSGSGFKSQVYRRKLADGTFEYNYAFAGTDDWIDVADDLTQGTGQSDQYDKAVNNAKLLSQHLGSKELTFSGHSLGGGLATAAALATGKNAITFNPAQLSMASIVKYNLDLGNGKRVHNYIVAGEALNVTQTLVNGPVFTHVGTDHFMIAPAVIFNASTYGTGIGHLMSTAMDAMNNNPKYTTTKKTRGSLQSAGALVK